MERADITIIGAGVVGLSVASHISGSDRKTLLIEKNRSFGMETSSRNSEVIHAGIYYPPGSLKGQLCLRGNELMYDICVKYDIPHSNTGKLIVACTDKEAEELPAILKAARDNGARGVKLIDSKEALRLEPEVFTKGAVLCPSSGIVDSHSLMKHFELQSLENGVDIAYGVELVSIDHSNGLYTVGVRDTDGSEYKFETRILINCAGLNSGRVSEIAGINQDEAGYRIHYCKGYYYRVTSGIERFPKMLIYPVPPAPAAVGIHTTPDLSGGMRLGPYDFWVDEIDYTVDDRYRDLFYDSAKAFLPFLKKESIQPDMAGIHPKIQTKGEGMRDFVIRHEYDRGLENFINLVGIESPGLTSSPAIGELVSKMVDEIY